jgi:sulfite dehydrogenase
VAAGPPLTVKGIAFDSGYGIASVELSSDGGHTWRRVALGEDLGPYSFRDWSMLWAPPGPGNHRLMVRAFNRIGESQGTEPLWNPAGYLRNVVEHVDVRAS